MPHPQPPPPPSPAPCSVRARPLQPPVRGVVLGGDGDGVISMDIVNSQLTPFFVVRRGAAASRFLLQPPSALAPSPPHPPEAGTGVLCDVSTLRAAVPPPEPMGVVSSLCALLSLVEPLETHINNLAKSVNSSFRTHHRVHGVRRLLLSSCLFLHLSRLLLLLSSRLLLLHSALLHSALFRRRAFTRLEPAEEEPERSPSAYCDSW